MAAPCGEATGTRSGRRRAGRRRDQLAVRSLFKSVGEDDQVCSRSTSRPTYRYMIKSNHLDAFWMELAVFWMEPGSVLDGPHTSS